MKNNVVVLSVALSVALISGASYAADLTVPAGQTYTVGAAQSDLRLEHLTLGDNARIVFAPGVTSWRVYAKQAAIGSNVVIDGRGAAGGAGEKGIDRSGDGKDCEDGRPGGNGAPGAAGSGGVSMNLWLAVESLGSLSVQADGGAGGSGGNGGRGQDGGQVNHCTGGNGGAGGSGGIGGSGGKGGAVALTYFSTKSLGDRLRVSSVGGSAGSGGLAGAGGGGNEGKFQRVTTGDRWFKGGTAGATGSIGAAGVVGSEGAVQLQLAASNTGPAWRDEIGSASAPTVAALQQQVQELRASTAVTAPSGQSQSVQQLLQQLQRRVDELEQRVQTLEKH